MRPYSDLLRLTTDLRIDVIVLCLVTIGAWVGCLSHARRSRATAEFSRTAGLTVVLLTLTGALLAEWITRSPGAPTGEMLNTLLVSRYVVLGTTAFSCGALLCAVLSFALLQTQRCAHDEIAQQLQLAKVAADDANKAKRDFLAVVSHEIRTPLNAVIGFAKLLHETKLEEVQRSYVATITSEGERLNALICDMLDLTKIEGGQLVLEYAPFAPVDVAQEVLRLFAARASEKKIDLRFEAQVTDPLLVNGDPLRFRQILVNLIDNALKFTPGGSVTVFLAWTPPGDRESRGLLVTRVHDSGIGIPLEKQHKLFQLFTQIDASTKRAYGGTGVGLAVCQRLISLMGGEISVRSDRGAGAEFKFVLPLSPLALSEAAANESDTATPFARPPRILVVDDLETNRFLLEVFLRRNGFEPELAPGGAEAVRLAAVNHYDAILMDLQMPEVDGYTATARIRAAEPPGHHTPIIALTASLGKGIRERCLAAGMDEQLTKPLDLTRFRRLLRSMIGAMVAA